MKKLICGAVAMAALGVVADVTWLDETDVTRMKSGWGDVKPNKSIGGNALRLGGREFKRGAGTHSPSVYKVATGGNAMRFEATVGIDDEISEDRASVVFKVWADGRLAAEVAAKRGRSYPLAADVTGAKWVTLEVTDAGDGNYFDHADWADAKFTFKDGTRPLRASELTRQLGILTPKAGEAPRINGATRFGVRPGHEIIFKLPVSGLRPMKLKVEGLKGEKVKGLDGVWFDGETGTLRGKIDEPGEYRVKFVAENAKGRAEREFTIAVGDRLCLTPPMGWNSWNAFASSVTPEKMKIATDKLIELGLDQHGYNFINIDDFWQRSPKNSSWDKRLAGAERNPDGTISPNDRFPDMKELADYIHSKGLRAGLYSSPGPYTCGGCTGSWLHELQDARSWAEWGYDYVKYDWCSYGDVATGANNFDKATRPYFLMGRFLKMQPRDIVLSLCQYGNENVSSWGEMAGGSCWRTTGDIFDTWASVYGGISAQAPLWIYSKPGAWNDADMLVLGRNVWAQKKGEDAGDSRLTPNEQYTHMSMWCMVASPLMIGCNLATIDEFTLSLLTNDEVLEIDQDELGAGAARIIKDKDRDCEIWARPLANGDMAFALLNTADEEQVVELPLEKLGVKGKWRVRDLWRQQDEGVFSERYAVSVPGHATHLIRLSPDADADHKPCLRDIRDNAWRVPFEADRDAKRGEPAKPCTGC